MNSTVSRRHLLGGTGLAAAMLAGGALPAAFGTTVMAQDGGKEFHGAYPYIDPGAGGHFNPFVTNAILPPPASIYGEIIWAPLGMYYWESQSWLPLLAENWAFITQGADAPTASPAAAPEGVETPPNAIRPLASAPADADTLRVTLREGLVWSDGTPITAQDAVDTLWCFRIMSNTVWKYLDAVEVVDERTFDCHMMVASTVVERYVIRNVSPMPSAIFGEWAQKARDLFSSGKTIEDPEGKQLLDQFSQFRPELPACSGPYMINVDSITNAQMTLDRNDKSFWADKAKFDRIINYNGETDTVTALVLTQDIDYATHSFPVASEKQMESEGIGILRPPVYAGPCLALNYGRYPEFADPKFRHALAYAIDRNQNGTFALGASGVASKYMTALSDALVPIWMDQDVIDSLNTYDLDLDKASALLEELGWTKDGDMWKKPDGSDASYELTFPAEYADWSASGQDLAEQLTAFGIMVEPRAITFTQQPIDVDKGNFDMALVRWGSSVNPHPHFFFANAFYSNNTLAVNNGGEGIKFPLQQTTEVAGAVDLDKLVVESAEGMSAEAQREKVSIMAQVFNELLPKIPLYERFGNNCALEGVRVTAWPKEGDYLLKQSVYADNIPAMMLWEGRLDPVDQVSG